MKRLLSVFLFLLLIGGMLVVCPVGPEAGTQDPSLIVYTPRGSLVDPITQDPRLTVSQRLELERNEAIYVAKGAKIVKEMDPTYNCFAYAFYERDGEKRAIWMEDPTIYWEDGSYIEVDHPVAGGIAVYTRITTLTLGSAEGPEMNRLVQPSHAAVIVSVDENEDGSIDLSGVHCISKWGKGSVVEHTADNCGYLNEHFSGKLTPTMYLNYFSGEIRYFVFNPENYASLHMTDEAVEGVTGASKNGLYRDLDGEVRFYVNGDAQYAGLVMDDQGEYYYINSTGEAVTDTTYSYTLFKANGLLPEGEYEFDEEGGIEKLPVPVDGTDLRNGIIRMPNGELRYVANCVSLHKGVVRSSVGAYYYFNSTLRSVKNTDYAFGGKYTNKLLPAGAYSFDDASVMGGLPTVIGGTDPQDLANGLLRRADGSVIFVENAKPLHAGLVADAEGSYYYVNSALCAVRGVHYEVSPARSGGLLTAPTELVFDENGVLINVGALEASAD